jgi:hypothetical protein
MDRIFEYFEEFMPDPALNSCQPMNTGFYMDRNAAIDAAKQFCAQQGPPSFKPAEYNRGNSNDVILALWNRLNSNLNAPADCVEQFTTLIDNCYSSGSTNYIWGGTQTTTTGWVFTVRPWSDMVLRAMLISLSS